MRSVASLIPRLSVAASWRFWSTDQQFHCSPWFLGAGSVKMTGISDASSGKKAFRSSATGIEFKGRSFSESIGDGGESAGASSKTGVTGEVRGSGVEYGLGRVSSLGIGWSAKMDSLDWDEVTWFRAAWIGVSTGEGAGEGEDKRP